MTDSPRPFGLSLKQRINQLEVDLAHPLVRLSTYHDMPFAIFRYDPAEELEVRAEVDLLKTRLENAGKGVSVVSLAALMWEALEGAFGGDLESFYQAEADMGLEGAVGTVSKVLNNLIPLDELVAQRLMALDPDHDVAFLTRAEALFPAYRTSALLDRLHLKRVQVPTVLFYPGELEGANGLRFMGVLEAEHNYRPKIY